MKGVLLLSCLVMGASNWANGQIKPYRQRFLVENQLNPFVIQAGHSLPVGDARFQSNSSNTRQALQRQRSYVDAFLIPLLRNEKRLWALGGGFQSESFIGNQAAIWQTDYHSFYASMISTGGLGKRWYWLHFSAWGLFANRSAQARAAQQSQWIHVLRAGYKCNPHLSVNGGLYFRSNFGDPVFLPMLQLLLSGKRWFLNVTIPDRATFDYIPKPRLRFTSIVRVRSLAYFHQSANATLQLDAGFAGLGMMYRVIKWTWLEFQIRKPIYATVSFPSEVEAGSFSNEWHLFFGLSVNLD